VARADVAPPASESRTASVVSDAAFDAVSEVHIVPSSAPPALPPSGGPLDHDGPANSISAAEVQAALSEKERIGRYVILRELGEGGMGRVYLAVRHDDKFHVRVALKIIRRLGGKRESMIRRFEQERQILAALTHPNIARLLDVGTTAEGDPYLVMEYIEGLPITSYCDRNGLNLQERLALFRTLCEAVHYAHQNLVVHRDIKPSNVVITSHGVVKLLDFGIAKVLNPNLAMFLGEATRTFGPMTPEYASPEQVLGEPISTATDIYSLGVLLYELLTGRRPYRLGTRVREDMKNIICNETPRRPSTVVTEPVAAAAQDEDDEPGSAPSRHTTTADEMARAREVTPQRLRKRLTGDLDNIVLMAMRKEPVKRYASAKEFSEDIQRHMGGLPVRAAPPSAWYVLRKYIARHRVGVSTAATIALLVLAGTIGTTLGWRKALEQQRLAERRLEAISEYPEGLIKFSRGIAHSASMTDARRQILALWDAANARLQAEAGDDPALRLLLARSHVTVAGVKAGVSTNNVGDIPGAQASLDQAQAILSDLATRWSNDPAIVEQQAVMFMRRGELAQLQGDVTATLEQHTNARRALEGGLNTWPDNVSLQRRLAAAMLEIGDGLKAQGQITQALEAYRESVARREDLLTRQPKDAEAIRDATVGWTRLASTLQAEATDDRDEQSLREALDLYRKIEATRQQSFDRSPTSTQALRDLVYARQYPAAVHILLGEFDDAVAAMTAALGLATDLVIADPANPRFADDYARILTVVTNDTINILENGGEPALGDATLGQLAASARRLRAAAAEQPENTVLTALAADTEDAARRFK
jgi:serine/threonine protein kinase/tetratricopeptide (TPR) repeat protein